MHEVGGDELLLGLDKSLGGDNVRSLGTHFFIARRKSISKQGLGSNASLMCELKGG